MNNDKTTIEQALLEEGEPFAAAKRERFWTNAGLKLPLYPVGSDAVLAMVDGNGYVCDRGLLLELLDNGTIPVVRESDAPRWSALNCFHLLCQLEGRRRWKPFSTMHRFKFNAAELAQLDAEAVGRATCFDDLEQFDVESLLIFMQDANDQSVRETLRVAVIAKLKQAGAL